MFCHRLCSIISVNRNIKKYEKVLYTNFVKSISWECAEVIKRTIVIFYVTKDTNHVLFHFANVHLYHPVCKGIQNERETIFVRELLQDEAAFRIDTVDCFKQMARIKKIFLPLISVCHGMNFSTECNCVVWVYPLTQVLLVTVQWRRLQQWNSKETVE